MIIKRAFDLSIAIFTLFIMSPILFILVMVIYLHLGRPIIFTQERPGLNGRIFTMMKFRTMSNQYDKNGHLLPDKQRLSRIGQLIRNASLDEFPGLLSVIKGDMSLVGPRPLLVEYLPLYSKEQARRHNVKPGITGWAQVNGRNAISWQEKFELDCWYVDNQSFWLDIKILYLTLIKVFSQSDINAKGEATMSKFTGNNNE